VHEDFAYELAQKLKDKGGRVEVCEASESLGKRIRNSQTSKIPFAIVVGDKEVEGGDLAVRRHGEEKNVKMSFDDFLKLLEM
jgi:threonyl-tRNA synthetase